MSILRQPETLRGLIMVILLIFFGSGAGFKIVGRFLRSWVGD